ncbi:two-component system sensor histidine kinase YkoH [Barrientosiimonas marina]|uniref:histidine kinase n=1 Tax=Lentibacillus kimchii TaxID=1542911 RepID=A0ABW2UTF4_9BACI
MKIRTKIYLISSVFLCLILLIMNVSIYFFYKQAAIQEKADYWQDQAELITENNNLDLLTTPGHSRLLRAHVIDDGIVRFINTEGHVVNEIENEEELKSLSPVVKKDDDYERVTLQGEKYLVAWYPVYDANDHFLGTLELARTLDPLYENLSLLLFIIIVASIVAVLLSILGGKLLANILLDPISSMTKTMRTIASSGQFRKIQTTRLSEDELYDMAITFNNMINRLEENFDKEKQFISDASHELKTPLTVIESYTKLIKRWGKDDESIREEAIEAISSETQRMKMLTEKMLNLAATERGDESIYPESIELVSFCQAIQRTLSITYNRNVQFLSDRDEIYVDWDPQKLKQVLYIFVDNAIKYSDQPVQINLKEVDNRITITVIDEGIGIPKEDLDQIFGRFYRVDKSRNSQSGGTGLGLSIAAGIIAKHGGNVTVESEEDKGTAFTIYLN